MNTSNALRCLQNGCALISVRSVCGQYSTGFVCVCVYVCVLIYGLLPGNTETELMYVTIFLYKMLQKCHCPAAERAEQSCVTLGLRPNSLLHHGSKKTKKLWMEGKKTPQTNKWSSFFCPLYLPLFLSLLQR